MQTSEKIENNKNKAAAQKRCKNSRKDRDDLHSALSIEIRFLAKLFQFLIRTTFCILQL